MSLSTPTDKIQNRLSLLKAGFKQFVMVSRLPMSAETKWMLEIVCLNQKPSLDSEAGNSEVTVRAKFYLEDYLYNLQTRITANKQTWITAMKNS